MDFFSVLTMIGGLAFFLYGMHVMGEGLTRISGGKLESILENLTSSPIRAVLLGMVVTAVIQSSSATTVMVVGFVNSGIMKLEQVVGIIMGANVGTTITSWILSLTGIESDNFFLTLLKPSSFSPVLAIIGAFFLTFSKNEKKQDIGNILAGFAVLMFGMETMSGAVKPLADVPQFTGLFLKFSHPVFGMVVGALLTAVIQSSSASVGILQALCATGAVTYGSALPIIMGQNIGTCVTATISAIGASKNAKRAAFIHFYFNLLGTILFMVIFYTLNRFVHFHVLEEAATSAGIAVIHSVFNVLATLCLLPFGNWLVKLACITIREDASEETEESREEAFQVLDVRFLERPALAMEQCRRVAVRMAECTQAGLFTAIGLIREWNGKKAKKVEKLEAVVDRYEDEIGTYLIKVNSRNLSEKDSSELTMLLHCIGDLERISDHSLNIMEAARQMKEKHMEFSKKAQREMETLTAAVKEIVETAVIAFTEGDLELAGQVEPLEEVIGEMHSLIKKHHVKRLRKGKCTIDTGFILSDINTSLERVSAHCSNIGVCLLQEDADGFEVHGYLDTVYTKDNTQYMERYKKYAKKYLRAIES